MIMPHASTTAMTRTFWRQGGFRLYLDSADNKVKFTDGVVTAAISDALTWDIGDKLFVYGGRKDGKLFAAAKVGIAGTLRQGESAATPLIESGGLLYLGNRGIGPLLDGVDDNMITATQVLLENEMTVALWCILRTMPTSNRKIIRILGAGTNRFYFAVNSATQMSAVRGENNTRAVDMAAAPLTINTPFHIIWYWKNTTGVQQIYVDNVLRYDGTYVPVAAPGDALLNVGYAAGDTVIHGLVTDIALYNKELSAAERASLQKYIVPTSGLLNYYRGDDNTGTTVVDSVGGANLTITGASWSAIEAANAILYNFTRHEGSAVDIDRYMAGVS